MFLKMFNNFKNSVYQLRNGKLVVHPYNRTLLWNKNKALIIHTTTSIQLKSITVREAVNNKRLHAIGSIYKACLERQGFRDRNQSLGCQGLGVGGGDWWQRQRRKIGEWRKSISWLQWWLYNCIFCQNYPPKTQKWKSK